MYWDINKPLSHGCFLNFIVGNRGPGKTYGSKTWCGNHFLKTGNRFMWVRRFKDEFAGNERFWGKVAGEFGEHKTEVKEGNYFIDGQLAGYKMVLSTSRMRKGVEFPLCDTIVFDEFLIDKGVYHYLPGEVEIFLDLIDTVFREREDVRVLCIANTITTVNPYFSYFKIMPPEHPGIITRNDILIERVANPEFIAQKKQTRFGRLIDGTTYGEYNLSAEFVQDSDTFIAKREGRCKYLFTLKYKSLTIGVWESIEKGRVYCSAAYEKSDPRVFALTLDDYTPNTLLLSTGRRNYYLKTFVQNFRIGNVYAENQQIKKVLFDIAKLLQSA